MNKRKNLKTQISHGLYIVSAFALIAAAIATALTVIYQVEAKNIIESINFLPSWASKIGISLTMFSSIFLGFNYFAESDIKLNHEILMTKKCVIEAEIEIRSIEYNIENKPELTLRLDELNKNLSTLNEEKNLLPQLNSLATISGIIMLNIGLFLQLFS